MMISTRKRFEDMSDIAAMIKIGNLSFDENEGSYTGQPGALLGYVRGAWHMFQLLSSSVPILRDVDIPPNTIILER